MDEELGTDTVVDDDDKVGEDDVGIKVLVLGELEFDEDGKIVVTVAVGAVDNKVVFTVVAPVGPLVVTGGGTGVRFGDVDLVPLKLN